MNTTTYKPNESIYSRIFNILTRIISLPIISTSVTDDEKAAKAKLEKDIATAESEIIADTKSDNVSEMKTDESPGTNRIYPMVQNNQNDKNNIIKILEYIISLFNLNKLNLVNFDLNNLFILLIIYYIIFIFTKDFIKGIVTTVIYTAIITYTIIRVYNYIYTIS